MSSLRGSLHIINTFAKLFLQRIKTSKANRNITHSFPVMFSCDSLSCAEFCFIINTEADVGPPRGSESSTFVSLFVTSPFSLWPLQQHHRLSRLRFLHGRHREGLQWQIQRAEEQWVSLDTCSRGAGPKTKVREPSLNSKLSLFPSLWQRSFAAAAVIVLHRLWTKKQAVTQDTCFPSCLSPTTNSCQCFYICARRTEFTPHIYFLCCCCCCCADRDAAPARAQPPPSSHPPPFPTTPWLSSSRTRSWTSRCLQSTTDPTSPAPPAGTTFV